MTPPAKPENKMQTRQYRVVAVHNFSKCKTVLFPGPLTHDEACRLLASVTKYEWRKEMVEEINPK